MKRAPLPCYVFWDLETLQCVSQLLNRSQPSSRRFKNHFYFVFQNKVRSRETTVKQNTTNSTTTNNPSHYTYNQQPTYAMTGTANNTTTPQHTTPHHNDDDHTFCCRSLVDRTRTCPLFNAALTFSKVRDIVFVSQILWQLARTVRQDAPRKLEEHRTAQQRRRDHQQGRRENSPPMKHHQTGKGEGTYIEEGRMSRKPPKENGGKEHPIEREREEEHATGKGTPTRGGWNPPLLHRSRVYLDTCTAALCVGGRWREADSTLTVLKRWYEDLHCSH